MGEREGASPEGAGVGGVSSGEGEGAVDLQQGAGAVLVEVEARLGADAGGEGGRSVASPAGLGEGVVGSPEGVVVDEDVQIVHGAGGGVVGQGAEEPGEALEGHGAEARVAEGLEGVLGRVQGEEVGEERRLAGVEAGGGGGEVSVAEESAQDPWRGAQAGRLGEERAEVEPLKGEARGGASAQGDGSGVVGIKHGSAREWGGGGGRLRRRGAVYAQGADPMESRAMRRAAARIVAALAVSGACWGLGAPAAAQEAPFWVNGASQGGDGRSFAGLVQQVGPAVVSLEVRLSDGSPFPGHPGEGQGQGSGFVITTDGYALTNNHVIEKAQEIVAVLGDGRRFSARVVGADPSSDVALIQLMGASGLQILPLGDSDRLRVGDWAVAIGSPLGLQSTVTAGIVSATGRRKVNPGHQKLYSNFIQTDASINPGNSGGPLLNTAGEVIGINTAINRMGQGIGFAIPINMVKTILPRLRAEGFVRRSWIGIMIQELDRDLARSFGLEQAAGALVTDVVTGGPGDRAGLRPGDVILALDTHKIENSEDLPWLASVAGVKREVVLTVWRDAAQRKVRLQLAEMPGAPAAPPANAAPEVPAKREGYGLEVRPLPREGRDDPGGVVVMRIASWSPAHSSGLLPGDVIVEVGGKPVVGMDDFHKLLKERPRSGVHRVKVRRARSTWFFAFPQD